MGEAMICAPVATFFGAAVLPVFDPAWKDKCLTCRSLFKGIGREGETMLICAQFVPGHSQAHAYCIDSRAEAGPCGPDASLWVAA